jgi:WhiB family transcriptional regulator, redox-sensing transcriptional regulator
LDWGSYVSLGDIEWRKLGACRGLDAGIFYPDDDDDALAAKEVCAGCGVRAACLEHALSSREKAGVWGGATERERRRIIRQRRRSA